MLGKHLNHCEDSLTAAVFTHLLHLPSEVFWRIVRNACYTERLPEFAGEPIEVDPWPKWNPEGTSTNNTYVEPDLFIRFPAFDLIIEAKRWDDGQQNPEQWRRELIGYANSYGEEQTEVRMIALGGIWSTVDSEAVAPALAERAEIRCPVHMCRWERLLAECKRMRTELRRLRYSTSQNVAQERIISDVIDLFAWHGFQTGVWFVEIASKLPRLSRRFQTHLATFKAMQNRD